MNLNEDLKNSNQNATNELDMDAYHEEGINPGEHKVFDISPEIHTFSDSGMVQLAAGDDKDIQRIKMMPGLLTPGKQAPGAGVPGKKNLSEMPVYGDYGMTKQVWDSMTQDKRDAYLNYIQSERPQLFNDPRGRRSTKN